MSPPPASIIIKPVNAPQSTSLTPVTEVRPITVAIITNMEVNALVKKQCACRNQYQYTCRHTPCDKRKGNTRKREDKIY